MAISYPTSLDSLTNPQPTDQMNIVSHADQHANANDAIEALETRLGITSAPLPTILDTDGTLAGNSDTKIPSQKAVKTYADSSWKAISGTWTASDADTISVNADITSIIQKGDKIKLTNNSAVKYFYVITTPVFATGSTTFDVTGEVNLVAGSITLPYFSKLQSPQGMMDARDKYKCAVYLGNSILNIGQNVETRITYDIKIFDTGNNFVLSPDYVFVAPIAGYYRISASVGWLNLTIGENVVGRIKVNGVTKIDKAVNTATIAFGYDFYFGGIVYMAKDNYLEVTTLHDGAGSTQDIWGNVQNRLDINFIGI